MHRLRLDKFTRIVWLSFAIQIFSISLNLSNYSFNYLYASISANSLETISEFWIEIENNIPENEDSDNCQGYSYEIKRLSNSNQFIKIKTTNPTIASPIAIIVNNQKSNLKTVYLEIHSPPPEV